MCVRKVIPMNAIAYAQFIVGKNLNYTKANKNEFLKM